MTAPPDRRAPFSAPRAALPVIVCFYLAIGLVPAVATIEVSRAAGATDALLGHFYVYQLIVGGIALTVLIAIRNGTGWGLSLLGGVSRLLAVLLVVALVASLLLAVGAVQAGGPGARSTGEYGLVVVTLCLPLVVVLLRGLRRVRWLDPTSTAAEWEPPARG